MPEKHGESRKAQVQKAPFCKPLPGTTFCVVDSIQKASQACVAEFLELYYLDWQACILETALRDLSGTALHGPGHLVTLAGTLTI